MLHNDQYAEARRLVQWGRDNFLVFGPLACETNQAAVRAKTAEDRQALDKKIKAMRTTINYLRRHPEMKSILDDRENQLIAMIKQRDAL